MSFGLASFWHSHSQRILFSWRDLTINLADDCPLGLSLFFALAIFTQEHCQVISRCAVMIMLMGIQLYYGQWQGVASRVGILYTWYLWALLAVHVFGLDLSLGRWSIAATLELCSGWVTLILVFWADLLVLSWAELNGHGIIRPNPAHYAMSKAGGRRITCCMGHV